MPLRMYLKQYVIKIVQIQKELLAAVFAYTKYHDFMYGSKAIIETDQKPNVTIAKKPPHA